MLTSTEYRTMRIRMWNLQGPVRGCSPVPSCLIEISVHGKHYCPAENSNSRILATPLSISGSLSGPRCYPWLEEACLTGDTSPLLCHSQEVIYSHSVPFPPIDTICLCTRVPRGQSLIRWDNCGTRLGDCNMIELKAPSTLCNRQIFCIQKTP